MKVSQAIDSVICEMEKEPELDAFLRDARDSVEKKGYEGALSDIIDNVLVAAFTEVGLHPNGEPNGLGKRVHDWLNTLNDLRIDRSST